MKELSQQLIKKEKILKPYDEFLNSKIYAEDRVMKKKKKKYEDTKT